MRDECFEAKMWLNRYYYQTKKLDAAKRKLEALENKLGSGVARYENDGTESKDADAARQRHEDTLLDYSQQKDTVEQLERKHDEIFRTTIKAISELDDSDHQLIALDRYIHRLKWNDIAEVEHLGRATVFRIHGRMLEKMVKILRSGRFE